MKTSVDQVGKHKVKLAVEVPVDDVGRFLDRTYRKLAGEIRVPGFRPGRVPRPIIDQRLGKDFVRQEALRDALPDLVTEAVREADLDVVSPPEIDVTSFEEEGPLQFTAVVEVRPEPELTGWEGLRVERPKTDVTDDEVGEQLERLRVRFSTLEVVERPLQSGDFAQIDLTTYRHDVTIDELTAKDYLYEVGSEFLVADLDAELEGKRKGDILKITPTLPEKFGDRAGWQVGMQILVKEVKARVLPDLDDDFAKTVSEFDTLDELQADLRQRLADVKRHQAERVVRERILDKFAEDGITVELPDGMVEQEIDSLLRQMVRYLGAQGIAFDTYLEAENLDVDAVRQRLRSQAERNLTLALGLDALVKAQGLEVGDEDRQKEVERLAAGLGREENEVRQMIDERGDWPSIEGDILRSKAVDLLVSRAEIVEERSA